MKKLTLLFALIYVELYAMDKASTLKMYHGIFSALTAKKSTVVYTSDREYREVFKSSNYIKLSGKPEASDIILVTNISSLDSVLNSHSMNRKDKKPIIFVTNYSFLKYSDEIVGAFYWRKGRTQLLFIEERLKKYEITLPKAYQNFMIDEL